MVPLTLKRLNGKEEERVLQWVLSPVLQLTPPQAQASRCQYLRRPHRRQRRHRRLPRQEYYQIQYQQRDQDFAQEFTDLHGR